jgi:uncharacterized protein YecE (DUF72 family)
MSEPLRVGTAGWGVPSRYIAAVPPGGSHLERYARRFNAAEINSSFHKPHQRKTYERWAGSTPDGFRFSVKIPKTITHERQLKDCGPLLDRFMSEIGGLGVKLGALLVQLPPKMSFEEKTAEAFFHELASRTEVPLALEPRHPDWFAADIDAWLKEHAIARVAADPAPVSGAGETGGSERITYFRWHGSPRMYFSDYDSDALDLLERKLDEKRARGIETWCMFDNTASGAALGNALALTAAEADGT